MGGKGVGGVIHPSPIRSARERSDRANMGSVAAVAAKAIRLHKPVHFKHYEAWRGSLVVVVEAMVYAHVFNTGGL